MLARLDDMSQDLPQDMSREDMSCDRGPRSAAAASARLCVATREVKPIDDLIRFVLGPDRAVVPDLKRKLPGRGVWVTARKNVISDAVRRNAFGRGFKADVTVSKDLPTMVELLLERSVLDALAIAHKAGAVVAGFTKVEAAIATDPIVALLTARDGADDGRRKLVAALHRRFGDGSEHIVTMTGFTSAQLDLALGRSNVVHAALLAQRPSATVLARWRALEHFRIGAPDENSNPQPLDSGTPKPGSE
jgi:uncharacterized protein